MVNLAFAIVASVIFADMAGDLRLYRRQIDAQSFDTAALWGQIGKVQDRLDAQGSWNSNQVDINERLLKVLESLRKRKP